MRFEPPIDHAALRAAIEGAFGIVAHELRFLPIGFAACYELRAADGARYFMKLWPSLRVSEPATENQRVALEFSRALHDAAVGIQVTYPVLASSGAPWAALDGAPFALFPFLDGEVRGVRSKAEVYALGGAVAALHLATPALRHLVPRTETFEVAYEAELRRNVDLAAALPAGTPDGALAAREWALETRADLEGALARLHALQSRVRTLECPQVVCHMDLHGGNVLTSAAGEQYVIDWDDVRLAPPEFDLWFGLEDSATGPAHLDALVAGYCDAIRRSGERGLEPPALHVEHLGFYLLRRDLEDVAIALARLLDERADRRDDERWAAGLRAWGAPRWARLDAALDAFATAIETRGARAGARADARASRAGGRGIRGPRRPRD